jgi:hypothetical protein
LLKAKIEVQGIAAGERVQQREAEPLLDAARHKVEESIRTLPKTRERTTDWGFIKRDARPLLGGDHALTLQPRTPHDPT